jgi:hypothetical protein
MSAITFPFQPTALHHRHGGVITTVYGIEHLKGKPRDGHSTDFWFFRADVEWDDGSRSERIEVSPQSLVADDAPNHPHLKSLLEAMNAYLAANGEWRRDAKLQGWVAHRGPGTMNKPRRSA